MKAASKKPTCFNKSQLSTIFLILALLLGSCDTQNNNVETQRQGSPQGDTPATSKKYVRIENFYKHLNGTIGQHAITMSLHANENQLSGNYFYYKVGVQLRLIGEISTDNTFQIFEIGPGGDTTGRFTGLLQNEEGLSGNWINLKTKQQLPFVLSERDTGYVKFEEVHYERSNCAEASKVKTLAADSIENWYDTLCTIRELTLLKFKLSNKKIADRLYSTMLEKAAAVVDAAPNIDSVLAAVNGDEQGFDDGVSVYVTTNTPLILSLGVSHAGYWYGAAHPNSSARSYNFDLRNGEIIGLADILREGYEDKLQAMAEKIFKTEVNNDFEFTMTEDFTIAPGGLQFNYDPYEIGSYAEGYIDIFIPYAQLKGMIKPGSVLDVWLKGI